MLQYGALAESVDILVKDVSARRLGGFFDFAKNCLAPVEFAKEFCTVSVNSGRRTGKTGYIKARADQNSVVVVPTYNSVSDYRRDGCDAVVLTADELVTIGIRVQDLSRFTTVYVDEPKLVFGRGLTERDLYATFCRGSIPTFVMLGTK